MDVDVVKDLLAGITRDTVDALPLSRTCRAGDDRCIGDRDDLGSRRALDGWRSQVSQALNWTDIEDWLQTGGYRRRAPGSHGHPRAHASHRSGDDDDAGDEPGATALRLESVGRSRTTVRQVLGAHLLRSPAVGQDRSPP